MKLGDVTIEKEEGTTWTEDGIHYIAAGPYGVSDGTDFLLYAPGTPADLIPAACRDWGAVKSFAQIRLQALAE